LAVQRALGETVKELDVSKTNTEEAKNTLEDKKDQEQYLKTQQEIEKQKTQAAQNQKAKILTQTKGQEAAYKKVLGDREKEAAKIRTALFALQDGSSIQFGTLYGFAKRAGGATGVSPSFIMAILSQETNLGKNTGQCTLRDAGGVLINSSGAERGEMRPNSVQPFLTITKALGRDSFKTRVSCAYQGYGGAMGIAQFMPATWTSYKSRIEGVVGTYADPWNNFHAVTAAALFLKDIGGGYNDDSNRNAACKYYSGRSCASGPGAAYGNSVLRKQAQVQTQIDILQGV
jgi:membrane-bound lytic murein transglycosylase B